eukprot:1079157-Pleurochrysis_carterae.AAC.1
MDLLLHLSNPSPPPPSMSERAGQKCGYKGRQLSPKTRLKKKAQTTRQFPTFAPRSARIPPPSMSPFRRSLLALLTAQPVDARSGDEAALTRAAEVGVHAMRDVARR